MIVPIIFNLHEYAKDKPMFLWIFYKFINFCQKYDMPIIAQKEYFIDPEEYKVKNHSATRVNNLDYIVPNINDINKIDSYIISEDETNSLKFNDSDYINYKKLIQKRNKKFENIINAALDDLEKRRNEKTEAMITWVWFPSLDYVCKKRNIKLLTYELSTIRKGVYNETLGYICFSNKYNNSELLLSWNKISKYNIKYFNRKELLSLFLNRNFLEYIKKMDDNDIYDLGIILGLKEDVFEDIYSKQKIMDVSEYVSDIFSEKNVIIREHPAYPYDFKNSKYIKDTSGTCTEMILKCKRILSTTSNVGYEAMLLGKTSYVLSKNMPFSVGTINNLDNIEDYVVDLKYLNYITFGFYAPFDLMFDIDYIRWRLTMPTPLEIYNYNLNYILRKNNIEDIFEKIPRDRQKYILKKVQKLNNNEIKEFVNYNCYSKEKAYIDKIKELENVIKMQSNHIEKVDNELNSIINSSGWKLLEKLRTIKRIGRKK